MQESKLTSQFPSNFYPYLKETFISMFFLRVRINVFNAHLNLFHGFHNFLMFFQNQLFSAVIGYLTIIFAHARFPNNGQKN